MSAVLSGLDPILQARRSYRALQPFPADDELIEKLAKAAALSPSCFNNQPWRYVFVRDSAQLQRVWECMKKGNEWTRGAGLIAALFTKPEWDCRIGPRQYYQFDCGMATAFLILKATELGFVAHPIAGFDPDRVKQVLDIPEDCELNVLIVFGRHAGAPTPWMTEKQIASENERPSRLPISSIYSIDRFENPVEK